MDLIPSEKEGEPFEEAMARVRRCIGGGGQGVGVDDDGSDSDLEVVAESITVNLRCPVRIMLLCNTTIFCLWLCANKCRLYCPHLLNFSAVSPSSWRSFMFFNFSCGGIPTYILMYWDL
jgi:hypothetical protein